MLRILLLAILPLLPLTAAAECCKVIEPAALPTLEAIVAKLGHKRVVYIGEAHDQYGHHLAQLELIRRLHAENPDLAIGFEQFQQPYQGALDDYIAGTVDEREMLARTEYFSRWRFDYRLYRPILRFALEQGIPLVALNIPGEVNRAVGAKGIEGLDEALKRWLPEEIDRSNEAYRERLRGIFHMHPDAGERDFDRFVDAQLLWDEGMARRAADYLTAHPGRRLVVLAGSGHLIHGDGIPDRVARRLDVSSAIVLCDTYGQLEEGMADFLLVTEKQRLPEAGMLGVMLDERPDGLHIADFAGDSAGRDAGLRKGDRLTAIAEHPVKEMGGLKLAMYERAPGERVTVEVMRRAFPLLPEKALTIEVELR